MLTHLHKCPTPTKTPQQIKEETEKDEEGGGGGGEEEEAPSKFFKTFVETPNKLRVPVSLTEVYFLGFSWRVISV